MLPVRPSTPGPQGMSAHAEPPVGVPPPFRIPAPSAVAARVQSAASYPRSRAERTRECRLGHRASDSECMGMEKREPAGHAERRM
jgi:hypothetical protein